MTTRTGNFPIGFYVKQLTWKNDLLAVAGLGDRQRLRVPGPG